MIHGHELFIAIRPHSTAARRDLSIQPSAFDSRLYLRERAAWKWLDLYEAHHGPGHVLELHLDQLFQRERENSIDAERRHHFHERIAVEHMSLAQRWRDGESKSRLLDDNDLAVLRSAAESWLETLHSCPVASDRRVTGLASVLRALLGAGKLGGGL